MSMAERRTVASATERGSRPILKLNPDLMIASAFAAVGILLAAYAAIAFPEMY